MRERGERCWKRGARGWGRDYHGRERRRCGFSHTHPSTPFHRPPTCTLPTSPPPPTPRTGGEPVDPGFTQAQLAMVDISTDLITERDSEIRKIVEAIAELAQIMRDMSTLVLEQGTMLDRIDHNIAQTSVKVGGGAEGEGRGA